MSLNCSTIRIYLGCKITDNYLNQQMILSDLMIYKPLAITLQL